MFCRIQYFQASACAHYTHTTRCVKLKQLLRLRPLVVFHEQLGILVPLSSSFGYPGFCLFSILLNAESVVVAAAQVVLGVGVADDRSALETECGFGIIFHGSLAIAIAEPQVCGIT